LLLGHIFCITYEKENELLQNYLKSTKIMKKRGLGMITGQTCGLAFGIFASEQSDDFIMEKTFSHV
jgi:hypothetical protein